MTTIDCPGNKRFRWEDDTFTAWHVRRGWASEAARAKAAAELARQFRLLVFVDPPECASGCHEPPMWKWNYYDAYTYDCTGFFVIFRCKARARYDITAICVPFTLDEVLGLSEQQENGSTKTG